jgi:hypothetical protein
MKLVRTLLALSALAGIAAAQSHPTFWRYVHPEARSLFGLDVSKAKASPLGARFRQELDKLGFKQMATSNGVDFVSEVDQVLVSSPGGLESAGKARGEVPLVVALAGKFSVPKLRQQFLKLGAQRTRYKGAELFRPKSGNTDMNAAVVNASILLLGDPAGIRKAIDHHGLAEPAAARSELFARASALNQLYDVWWVSEISPGDLAGSRLPQAQMFQSVRGFDGGVSLRQGLEVALNLRTADEESARQMGSAVQALLVLATAGAEKQEPEVKEFLDRLKIGAEGGVVNARIAYSTDEITKTFESVMAKRMGGRAVTAGGGNEAVLVQGDGEAAPATLAVSNGLKEEPFVVRIYNAEGGTREVAIARD